MARKSLLVAGFGAFPGHAVNPAQIVAEKLRRRQRAFALAGIDLHVAVLPVEHDALSPKLSRLFAETSPDAVLLLGVAGRRKKLSVETLARNRVTILRPDAAKTLAWSRFIVHGAPDLLRSPCEAARLAAVARKSGVAAAPSRDAGDYLCNESFFLSLLMDRRACFIHLPDWRGAPLNRAARAIENMAKALALA
ncbi:pyroglutamyl-peptidase I [uncultured Rhodoblastus sp.]|uniref:pyroglutamyl-peptidase I family protein n=1 Tax=uncultured Rhodoblastus sp. TaxID=543037 RepID=UPI0025D2845D|nr:pyroglutamyl-peptidase I [uncultured Rhodoblastus sp.]